MIQIKNQADIIEGFKIFSTSFDLRNITTSFRKLISFSICKDIKIFATVEVWKFTIFSNDAIIISI